MFAEDDCSQEKVNNVVGGDVPVSGKVVGFPLTYALLPRGIVFSRNIDIWHGGYGFQSVGWGTCI
jgi:hypothetical protein